MGIVYPLSGTSVQIDVPIGEKIAIFTQGVASIQSAELYANIPSIFSVYSGYPEVNNEEVILGTFSSIKSFKITAGAFPVYYEVGASPSISINWPDALTGANSTFYIKGLPSTASSGTTAGTVGGSLSRVGAAGGEKTGTGTANGGDGGSVSDVAGVGGETAATSGSATGGAGGELSRTAGAGGAASAGTANGGAGGSIVDTPGSGGTSAGGTAGIDGMLIQRGLVGTKQVAPIAKTTSSNLKASELKARIITVNQGAAATSAQQLPLASNMDTEFPDFITNDSFDFSVINISTVDAEDASVTTNTGWTLVGAMDIPAYSADGSLNSSAPFRAVKTGTATWTLYRVG